MNIIARLRTARLPLLFVLLAIGWTLLAGKDVGWDLINHQLYLPFSLFSGRHATDLFAAGPQSFQNPLGYLPIYLLARSALPAWAVGVVLAALQAGLIAWALHHIIRAVFGRDAAYSRWRAVAMALAFVAPVFLYTVGTSGNDLWGTGLVLVSLAITIRPAARPLSLFAAALAGGALGLALAIKPTNAIFALPMLGLLALQTATGGWRPLALFVYVAGLGAALAVAAGFWSAWLWRDFGNPVFPLFNALFQSPFAPVSDVVALRFLPTSLLEGLARLWAMTGTAPYTMVEGVMPDFRPLAATVAAAAAVVVATRRHGGSLWFSRHTWQRSDVQLGVLLCTSYLLWMLTSGNARYAVAWFLLVGVLLARALQVCWPYREARGAGWAVWLIALPGLLAALQLLTYLARGDLRSLPAAWDSRTYVPVDMPQRLVEQPFLHLSLGGQTHAGLAMFMHPAGAMSNLTGQMVLPTDGPLGDRLRELLARWQGRTRFLFAPTRPLGSPQLADIVNDENWGLMHRVGLQIDITQCDIIRLMPRTALSMAGSTTVLSCPAIAASRPDPELDEALAQATRVFKAIEAACPRVFGPGPLASEYRPGRIWRRYMNSDARIDMAENGDVSVLHPRATAPVRAGNTAELLNNPSAACRAWATAAAR